MWILYFMGVAFYITYKGYPVCGKAFGKAVALFFALYLILSYSHWHYYQLTLSPEAYNRLSIGAYCVESFVIIIVALLSYFIFAFVFKGVFKLIRRNKDSKNE